MNFEKKGYKKLRYQYLLDKFPESEEVMVEKYMEDYKKRAHFVGVDLYKWGTVYASEPYELWLCGVLTLEGIRYEHD